MAMSFMLFRSDDYFGRADKSHAPLVFQTFFSCKKRDVQGDEAKYRNLIGKEGI